MAVIEKKFPSELATRGTVLVADKLLIHNITTGATAYTTVNELLDALGIKGQVKFPATQVPSTNVNTLDDYEEGEWTAAFACGTSGTITINTNWTKGWYVKVGKLVFFGGYFAVTSVSSPVGVLTMTGLPFPAVNQIKYRTAVSICPFGLNAGADYIVGEIREAAEVIIINGYTNTSGSIITAANLVKANTQFTINGSYIVS